mmetsp:Transcript_110292/g.235573  ORF Transcript_110292/g.235573 Transcript_110292/m.235573 type:complete len:558 (+) Transcript_110292:42-1715(+)
MAAEGDEAADVERRPPLWSYGVNHANEEPSADVVKAFKGVGNFRADFADLCTRCGIVPHPALSPPRDVGAGAGDGAPEGPALCVRSTLLDRAGLRVMKCVLPTCNHLEVLRFSGCRLDVEMLQLLRAGLTETSTVHTLHLDWNPLDVPVDVEAMRKVVASDSFEELDNLELERDRLQAERSLRAFGEQLQARSGGVNEALCSVAETYDPDFAATAIMMPLTLNSWTTAFEKTFSMPTEVSEVIFHMLDSPSFGLGDGLVPLARVEGVVKNLPPLSPEEEAADPIAATLGSFVDATSTLELASFRYCNIGRLECQAIARSLRSCQHIRALNLWGNCVCDASAATLAEALEGYFGLQFLGLGRNLVSHVGLESLCKVLGSTRIDEKEQAEQIMKTIKDRRAERDKKLKGGPPPPKTDAGGRARYMPKDFFHVDSCDEKVDAATGQPYWIWTRNLTLRTLVLENNPVSDVEAVLRLQPLGPPGDLVLRGTPCVQGLIKERERKAAEAAQAPVAAQAEEVKEAVKEAVAEDGKTPEPQPPASGGGSPLPPQREPGWRLVLQ